MILAAGTWAILHVSGALIGIVSAFYGDYSFLSSVRDGVIGNDELKRVRVSSRFVWFGLSIIIISGIGLFASDPERLLVSQKFWAKMTIVLALIINGIIFHYSHIPCLKRHEGKRFCESKEFLNRRPILLASGALSFVSWVSAFILGSLKSLPYSYYQIVGLYLAFVFAAIFGALILKNLIIPIRG